MFEKPTWCNLLTIQIVIEQICSPFAWWDPSAFKEKGIDITSDTLVLFEIVKKVYVNILFGILKFQTRKRKPLFIWIFWGSVISLFFFFFFTFKHLMLVLFLFFLFFFCSSLNFFCWNFKWSPWLYKQKFWYLSARAYNTPFHSS